MRSSNRLWIAIALALGVLLGAACTTKPVYNVSSAPVPSARNASLDEVGRAIQRAGVGLGWHMQPTKPGHMMGTLSLRTHRAVVDIDYTTQSYSIRYKDSQNLDFDGANIHKNYNGWVQNLDKSIQAQLLAL